MKREEVEDWYKQQEGLAYSGSRNHDFTPRALINKIFDHFEAKLAKYENPDEILEAKSFKIEAEYKTEDGFLREKMVHQPDIGKTYKVIVI